MSEESKDIIQSEEKPEESTSQTSSYRSIFKATSLFGGVQVYQILIGIIKSKFVAVLLGPAGMGIQGLYQSTLDVIKSLTAFGLEQSAVRDISEANGTNDSKRIGRTVATVRKLVWLTGTLGLVAALIFSPLLSQWTFGNGDFTWGFIILSSTLLLNQICAGQKVVLQGMRRLKDLAKASAIGSTVGLLVSIPLYYWLGVKGIVPTMVLISATALLLSWFYSRKVPVEKVEVKVSEAVQNGKSMLKMGVAMSVSGILVSLSGYLLRWFIRQQGGVDEVGLFAAGLLITHTYVGMVFSAMSTDYYPRLASVNKNNVRCREVINQQGEIALLIITPIIISCILLMPFIIKLIYSEEFLPANDYIMFAVSGMLFKAASFVVSYVFLAKAESKLFIINEISSCIYCVGLNIVGYYLYGLTGLGISFAVGYIIYLAQVYLISRHRYGFNFSESFLKIFAIQLIMVVTSLTLMLLWKSVWVYLPSGILFIICTAYSLNELNKRIEIKAFVEKKMRKNQ